MRDLIVRYSLLANVLRLHASYVSYLELEWCRTEIYVFSYICINKTEYEETKIIGQQWAYRNDKITIMFLSYWLKGYLQQNVCYQRRILIK